MSFSEDVKMRAMVACGRRCCICHKFCGNNMEVHHIVARSEGGTDAYDNAIPLCFDCHAEVRQYDSKHPKGIKFTAKELRLHRDNWYHSVMSSSISDQKTASKNNPTKVTQKDSSAFLIRAITGKQLMSDLYGAYAIDYDYDEPETQEDQEILMRFMQKLQDIVDLEDTVFEVSERMNMSFELTSDLRELENHHFWVFTLRDVRKLPGEKTLLNSFPVLVIRVLKDTNNTIINIPISTKKNSTEYPIPPPTASG